MMNKILLSVIENLNDELIGTYRKLHENPELPNEEFETTKLIEKLLKETGTNRQEFLSFLFTLSLSISAEFI